VFADHVLSVQVVWDDSIMRLFVVPTGSRPLGLLFRASKGQVDFEGAVGEGGAGGAGGTTVCDRHLAVCARLQLSTPAANRS
jgi:hypothetical protein